MWFLLVAPEHPCYMGLKDSVQGSQVPEVYQIGTSCFVLHWHLDSHQCARASNTKDFVNHFLHIVGMFQRMRSVDDVKMIIILLHNL